MVKKIKEIGKKLLYCPECGKYIMGIVYENLLTEVDYWQCNNEEHKIIVLNKFC